MLPQEAIEEYKDLYQKRFGVKLNDKEASLRANNLLNLYRAVYGQDFFFNNNFLHDKTQTKTSKKDN